MGSLMSGWSSSVLSDKEARLMRNRSLTKEEVAAFWRQQHAHHGRPNAGSPREVPVRYCCTSSDDDGFFLPENAADSSATNHGWWTRSSWAFLNGPPPTTTTREEVVLGSRAPRSFVVVACDQQLHAARIVTGNA